MKGILQIVCIVLCSIVSAHAQETTEKYILNGVIQDSVSGKPVAYATISLLDASGNNFASTYSLESGAFKFLLNGPGSYKLEVSFVGYRTKTLQVEVTKAQQNLKLVNILLAPGNDH